MRCLPSLLPIGQRTHSRMHAPPPPLPLRPASYHHAAHQRHCRSCTHASCSSLSSPAASPNMPPPRNTAAVYVRAFCTSPKTALYFPTHARACPPPGPPLTPHPNPTLPPHTHIFAYAPTYRPKHVHPRLHHPHTPQCQSPLLRYLTCPVLPPASCYEPGLACMSLIAARRRLLEALTPPNKDTCPRNNVLLAHFHSRAV
jgi:hypothetical protein